MIFIIFRWFFDQQQMRGEAVTPTDCGILVTILSLFRNSVHVLGRIDIGSWKKTELESKLQEIHTAQLKEQRLQLDLH
jgi:hypothetical protein